MQTQAEIIEAIRNEKTPFWYVLAGKTCLYKSTKKELEESISELENVLAELPNGSYEIKAANNPNKHNGADRYYLTITTGKIQAMAVNSTTQQAPISTNGFGIPDSMYQQIVQGARKDLMLEMMFSEWKEYKPKLDDLFKRFDRVEKLVLEDSDGDGIPDISQAIGNVTNIAESANQASKVFRGKPIFGE